MSIVPGHTSINGSQVAGTTANGREEVAGNTGTLNGFSVSVETQDTTPLAKMAKFNDNGQPSHTSRFLDHYKKNAIKAKQTIPLEKILDRRHQNTAFWRNRLTNYFDTAMDQTIRKLGMNSQPVLLQSIAPKDCNTNKQWITAIRQVIRELRSPTVLDELRNTLDGATESPKEAAAFFISLVDAQKRVLQLPKSLQLYPIDTDKRELDTIERKLEKVFHAMENPTRSAQGGAAPLESGVASPPLDPQRQAAALKQLNHVILWMQRAQSGTEPSAEDIVFLRNMMAGGIYTAVSHAKEHLKPLNTPSNWPELPLTRLKECTTNNKWLEIILANFMKMSDRERNQLTITVKTSRTMPEVQDFILFLAAEARESLQTHPISPPVQ